MEDDFSVKDDLLKMKDDIGTKFPTRDEMMKIIDSLKDLSDSEKLQLKESLKKRVLNAETFKNMQKNGKYFSITTYEYLVFIAMVLLVLLFFGEI